MFTKEALNIISVNFFSILFSLLNLVIIFLIAKFLLYKPVKKMLQNRQKTIEDSYKRAEDAENEAEEHKEAYEKKLESAKDEANDIINSAVVTANARGKEIIDSAKEESQHIVNQAKENAELEIKRAEATIKGEIVDVSTKLAEKLLEREINEKDHSDLIDSFIDEIGEE
jgi:F-type H+-transporting ATPase subunit b